EHLACQGCVPIYPALHPSQGPVMSSTVVNRAPDVRARPSRLSVKKVAMAGAALLIGAVAGWYGYNYWTVGRFIESTDDAYVGADVTAMAPKVAGFIAEVAVIDNQPVRQGDLLIKLDDRDYRAALARA